MLPEINIDLSVETDTIKAKGTSEDGGPGSGNRGHQGVPGEIGGSVPKPSARGANPKCTGFANEKLLARHVKRHGKEYPRHERR